MGIKKIENYLLRMGFIHNGKYIGFPIRTAIN